MIISHRHKYIFLKPGKVAGTALEIALKNSCGELDIITPISQYDSECDQDNYFYKAQNNFGYCEHMAFNEIVKLISAKYKNYRTISVVRNPWDMVVSRWFWECWIYSKFGAPKLRSYINMFKKIHRNKTYTMKQLNRKLQINLIRTKISKNIVKNDFQRFVENFPHVWTNNQYYFHDNEMIIDSVIRYEELQSNYILLCKNLGIQYTNLLKVKSKIRPHEVHYSEYYNSATENIIRRKFQKQIEHFGYEFNK